MGGGAAGSDQWTYQCQAIGHDHEQLGGFQAYHMTALVYK